MPFLDQQPLCGGTPLQQGGLEPSRQYQPQLALVAGMELGQALDIVRHGLGVEHLGVAPCLVTRGQHGVLGIAEPVSHGNAFALRTSARGR